MFETILLQNKLRYFLKPRKCFKIGLFLFVLFSHQNSWLILVHSCYLHDVTRLRNVSEQRSTISNEVKILEKNRGN